MASKGELIRAIQKAAGTFNKNVVDCYLANVTSVDETEYTCSVLPVNGEVEIENVLLSTVSNDGMVLIPEVDSLVMVTTSKYSPSYVSLFSDLSKIIIVIGESKLEIVDGSIKFNDGTLDGLVKVNSLVTRLNNIENDINTLKTAFVAWTVTPNDGGAALKTATSTWYSNSLTPTVKNDIENPKIKQ